MARVTLHEYCDEARALMNSRAYEDAVAICRHILQRYPKHIQTYQILGEACLEKGELEEATDIFNRLLRADPENFVAWAGLGIACEDKGQLDEAIRYMERAFGLEPNNDAIRSTLRRLYGKRDGTEPTRIKLNKVALARLYARGGQYRQAIEEFRSLLEPEPDRTDIKISLAETLWRDGRRVQAAEMAGEILQTSPYCLKAILLLGMIQIDKGRGDEGSAILAKARGLDPENNLAQVLFGEQSPLPSRTVKIPRVERKPEPEPAPTGILEPIAAPSAEEEPEPVPTEILEPIAAPSAEEEAELEPSEILEPIAALSAEEEPEPEPSEIPEAITAPSAEEEPELEPSEILEAITASSAEEEPEVTAAEILEPATALAAEEQAEVVTAWETEVLPEEATLASAEAIISAPLSDVERYKLQLEQKPKDNETRLALARAYRDQEQIKLALEQYSVLVRAKSKLLSEVVGDMESTVASRPDNLEAHELLADMYVKNGQLQKAIDRYRWILQRLEQRPA